MTPSGLKMTSLLVNPNHMAQLRQIAKAQGLVNGTAALVRLAILQYIRREARKQDMPVIVPGRARRRAILGE
jgi:hypothetical protein